MKKCRLSDAHGTGRLNAGRSRALILKSLSILTEYVERESYRGFDPYDALLSPAASHPVFNRPLMRIVFTQILRRLPFNPRPMLGIPPGLNPKGLSLFLSGYAARPAAAFPDGREARIRLLVRLLHENRSPGYEHPCWGYHFPWQNRNQLYPSYTPTLVNTGFAGHAHLDAYAATGDPSLLKVAEGSAGFILESLPRVVDDETRLCLGYTPLDRSRIFNSNAIGAAFLARVGSVRNRRDWLHSARRMMNWVAEHQRPDGSWVYGEAPTQGWIDLHHTAFILESLSRYQSSSAGNRAFAPVLERGTAYFLRTFFREDGSASLWHDRPFPKDIHAFAAVSALCAVPQNDAVRIRRRSLIRWLVTHMQDPSGYFYYQAHRHYCIRIPYMRWSQAWAFYGLSAGLAAERSREAGS
ncbi:terpene cyclase/mutase family protein [bacterium]|nr:terpene cyclase/mutase family protein [bacterium]